MFEDFKQFLNYSKEFRIAAPKISGYDGSLEKIVGILKTQLSDPKSTLKDDSLLKLASEIGTTVWRLQQRLATKVDASDTMKRITRDLESVRDTLSQGDIEIKDHTGEKYDGGMALNVIAFQPTPGITREQIIETIKPTIYHKNKLIQMGQVIVGVPEKVSSEDTPK